jgi:hypothetical protein
MTETLIEPQSNVMPEEIRRAVGVLWLSVLLGVVASLVNWRLFDRSEDPVFSVVVQIFTFGFMALLIWKISQGRNWARVTWLVFFVGGCLINVLFTLFSKTYRVGVFGSFFPAAVFVVQTAIQFYAIVLLFTAKGRTWFARKP